VPPKFQKRGQLSTPATPPRVGPKTLANLKPTRVGKWGVQGGEAPMAGAVGGAPPQNLKGGELPTLATCPRVGPKTLANPKPTRVGKRGSRGLRPLAGGRGGVPPQNLKRGELPTLATPPRVGPKTLANLKPTRVGERGSRGRKPPGRGLWGVSLPQNQKGASHPH